MSTTVNKTKNTKYKILDLQREINSAATIVPSCISITASENSLAIEFAAPISAEEDIALDAIILAHIPSDNFIDVNTLTFSELDGKKLAVHPSYKPSVPGGVTYAVWTGCGDDVDSNPSVLGGGPLLHIDTVIDTPEIHKDVKFDGAAFGRVWIHEAYLKFEDAGPGDYVSAAVMAVACPLQQSVNLNLELDGAWVKFAAGGAGTGTHGFAGTPALIPRTFLKDGDWDFDGVTLTPNVAGTGNYKISQVEAPVHRYVSKIPCHGSSPYFSITSDETAEIPLGYFLRITAHNASNTVWHLSVFMELYRERTV
jgi:hypothetical protein